jgi:hypothetical protein
VVVELPHPLPQVEAERPLLLQVVQVWTLISSSFVLILDNRVLCTSKHKLSDLLQAELHPLLLVLVAIVEAMEGMEVTVTLVTAMTERHLLLLHLPLLVAVV